MLIVLAACGCSTVVENPTQNPKIETLNPAKNEKCSKKFKMKLIMPVTSECSTVAENLSHDPNIGGSNQATGTRREIMTENNIHN